MSNRLTKGTGLVGKVKSDVPGDVLSGIPFSVAGTTAVITSFKFPDGAIVEDVYIKITSVAATSGSISIGLATGASSAGAGTCYVNGLLIGTTGTYVMCASTSQAVLSFTYGSYFVSSTSESVTILKKHVIGSTDTYRYLNYTCGATDAVVGIIYPQFHELS